MDAAAKSKDLLYVGGTSGDVTVYSYPAGKLLGTLTDPTNPEGECVDKSGDVFVTNLSPAEIFEYAHGGKTPIETLQGTDRDTDGCGVDPTTGNLAVASLGFGSSGNVAIYPNGTGSPSTYTDPNIYYYFDCAYDDQGNLWVDGQSYGSSYELAELPKGSSTFTSITLDQFISFPSSVQWVGKYLLIGDQALPYLYKIKMQGTMGKREATIDLNGAKDIVQFWIDGHTVVGGDSADNEVQYWPYPRGGNATKTITEGVGGPLGLTISKASKIGPRRCWILCRPSARAIPHVSRGSFKTGIGWAPQQVSCITSVSRDECSGNATP